MNSSTSDFSIYRLVFYTTFILCSLPSPMGHYLFGAQDSAITLISLALSIISLVYYSVRRTLYPALMLLVCVGFFCEMWLLTYFGSIIALLLILVAADLIWHSNLLQKLKLTPRSTSFGRTPERVMPTFDDDSPVSMSSPRPTATNFSGPERSASLLKAPTLVVGPADIPSISDFALVSPVEAEIPAVGPGQIAFRERGFAKVFSLDVGAQLLVGRGPEAQIWVALAEVALRQLLITRQATGWRVENLSPDPLVQISEDASESFIPLEGVKQVVSARLSLGNAMLFLG